MIFGASGFYGYRKCLFSEKATEEVISFRRCWAIVNVTMCAIVMRLILMKVLLTMLPSFVKTLACVEILKLNNWF